MYDYLTLNKNIIERIKEKKYERNLVKFDRILKWYRYILRIKLGT